MLLARNHKCVFSRRSAKLVLLACLNSVCLDHNNKSLGGLDHKCLFCTDLEERGSKPRCRPISLPHGELSSCFEWWLSSAVFSEDRREEEYTHIYIHVYPSLCILHILEQFLWALCCLIRSSILSWELYLQELILNTTPSQRLYSSCHTKRIGFNTWTFTLYCVI